ncbi:MAG TPA: DsbE family thiol:disulfide interchange protein [Stellaceae bacterium]|nr:DsbE family thiol:disulfide interchange protein [Stellaceae bacterium]
MLRRLPYLLPAVAFAALLGYFLAALLKSETHDPSELPSVMLDQPAPDFALEGLGDKPGFARSDLAGKVVLVNFFASWCVPCRAEHPLLARLAETAGVPLYGIDYKDKPADAERFLSQYGSPFRTVGVDPKGRLGIDFGVTGVPETFLIDKSGKIRFHRALPLTPEAIDKEILPLVQALQKS